MEPVDVTDPRLYESMSVEQLDEHIASLRKLRIARGGSREVPSRDGLAKMLDPDGDNFCGSGLTMREFMMAMDIQALNSSFLRQGREEKRRRLGYVIRLSVALAKITEVSVWATRLAEGAIEDVIDGDWAGVRECAKDFAGAGGFLEHVGPDLQALWRSFASVLQEAFDTRPGTCPPEPGN